MSDNNRRNSFASTLSDISATCLDSDYEPSVISLEDETVGDIRRSERIRSRGNKTEELRRSARIASRSN
jgi:hypothetical protein